MLAEYMACGRRYFLYPPVYWTKHCWPWNHIVTAGPGVILSSVICKVTNRTHEPMGSYKSRGREWMRSQGQMKASASLSGDYPEALIKDRPVLLVPRCVSPSPPLLSFSDILVGSSMYPDCTPPQTHIVRLRFSATGVSLKATKAT